MNFRLSNHALEEVQKRKIPISFVETVQKIHNKQSNKMKKSQFINLNSILVQVNFTYYEFL
jgi:hypothetical protein